MVQKSSSAASEARHPTPWCSALWAPRGHPWHVPRNLRERTYHILLRLPRLSWGTVASSLCWPCANIRILLANSKTDVFNALSRGSG